MPHNKKIDSLVKAREEAVRAFKEAERKYHAACRVLPEAVAMEQARRTRDCAAIEVVRETEKQRRKRSMRTERIVEWDVRYLNADGDVDDVEFYSDEQQAMTALRAFVPLKDQRACVCERHVQVFRDGVCIDDFYRLAGSEGCREVIEVWNNGEEDRAEAGE